MAGDGDNVICPCRDCARSIEQCVGRIQVAFHVKLQGTQAGATKNEGSSHCSVTPRVQLERALSGALGSFWVIEILKQKCCLLVMSLHVQRSYKVSWMWYRHLNWEM